MSEQISELLDAEVEKNELAERLNNLLSNASAKEAWRDYQMIGDVMRNTYVSNDQLTKSIMDQIHLEPTILSPNAIDQVLPSVDQANENIKQLDDVRAKRALPRVWSVAASAAAVVVVGLFLANQQMQGAGDLEKLNMAQSSEVEIKATPDNLLAAVEPTSIPAEYLEAHRVSAPSVGSFYIQPVNYTD